MKIVSLQPSFEPLFWKKIRKDIPHYFFFAFDWKYNKDDTKIFLALENKRIYGMMLVYKEEVVNLRGNPKVAKFLLEELDLEKVEIQALKEHRPYILEKYEPIVTHEMLVMLIRKGKEKTHVKHPVVALGAFDAERIAAIMRTADPEFWGDVTSQNIISGMNTGARWFGVKVNGELVSVGNGRATEWTSLIGVVATSKSHRNKGYATSIVSTLTKNLLKEQDSVIIFVRSENAPAIHVYEKVGFEQYKKYFFMRGIKRKL